MSDTPKPNSRPPELQGLDPGELLARGLNTVQPSGGASAWTPPTAEELARLLPQYSIVKLLGRGGMGAVYQGFQLTLERPVAIKLLPAELALDPEFVTRFKREARTLAKLQHSRIVTVHDSGQTSEGHLYFVMEYIDGSDLRTILRGPGLDPEQAIVVIGQLCDALQAAHREGVVHRDIKPENVLITRDGYVKLADFGLARAPQKGGAAELTKINLVMGTPAYMAPEQHSGATKADHRSDIFALGVLFYEMLTGEPPRGVFEPPSHKVQVDARIDEVVRKALQSEPDRRYQLASEMKTDVEHIRATSLPAAAKPTTTAAPAKNAAVRWLACAFGLLLIAVAVMVSGAKTRRDSNAQKRALTGGGAAFLSASKEQPFINTLGMKFVPVPTLSGQRVLFSVWETRRRDYGAFARANRVDDQWAAEVRNGFALGNSEDAPAHHVSWEDAHAFCQWLTQQEAGTGKLAPGLRYRLPTDEEWSRAVGLTNEIGATPKERSGRDEVSFPWGYGFPPPKSRVGNYADQSLREAYPLRAAFNNYRDGFATLAPVGSFEPNAYGIYDLGGNVWEWCEDVFDPPSGDRTERGGSWMDPGRNLLASSSRTHQIARFRVENLGFRIVLSAAPAAMVAPPPPSPSPTPAAKVPLPSPVPSTPSRPVTTPVPTPKATPATGKLPADTSAMKQVVDVQFARGLNDFGSGEDETWRVRLVDGEYQMILRNAGLWWPGEPALQDLHINDFVCEVRARIVSSNYGGWGLRLIRTSGIELPWRSILVNARGEVSSDHNDDGPDVPWTRSPAMNPASHANTLRVEGRGSQIRVFVNGVFLFERAVERLKPDSSLTLFCFANDPPVDVRLQSVQVWVPR